MATKRAKTLDPTQLETLLAYIDANSAMPLRDRLMVLLSFKAGLRVAEIAKIDFSAMTDAEGRIGKMIRIFSQVAKKGRERQVPMHRDIKQTLAAFMKAYPNAPGVAISSMPYRFTRDKTAPKPEMRRMSVNALTQYYRRLLEKAGFEGTSSHSGRRTFATSAARMLSDHHQSLRDLQLLLGHARLDTTERYLEPTNDTFDLINAM